VSRLLAIGDMHLGQLPAALPEVWRARARDLGPESAWYAAVGFALDERVDAVLLAGDLVARNRDFLVAYGQLKHGLAQLAEAGIPAIAVAGNHDVHVLPRLADELEHLHLLGRRGRWQRHDLEDCAIIGWSFAHEQERSSPLSDLPKLNVDRPLIGLLHCDLDQPGSRYAPVTQTELEAAPVAAWLLGHIHQPGQLQEARPIGYLGSLAALKASDTGPRGPWLIELIDQKVRATHCPLGGLRYEALAIDCAPLQSPDELEHLIIRATRERIDSWPESTPLPSVLGLRLSLIGHSRLAAELPALTQELSDRAPTWREGDLDCFIEQLKVQVEPPLDLQDLARRRDPSGLLARRIVSLRDNDEHAQRLIEKARESFAELHATAEFSQIHAELSDAEIAERLERAGLIALARLLAQRTGAS